MLLPQRVQQSPSAVFASASDDLYLLRGGKDVDPADNDVTYQVVRRSDSTVLRTFAYTPSNPYDFPYRLIGDDLVRVYRSGSVQVVEVTDAASGAVVRTFPVSGQSVLGETVLQADLDWALVSTPADGGGYALQVTHADGTSTPVSASFTDVPAWVGATGGTAYLQGSGPGESFAIDLATGTRSTLPVAPSETLRYVLPGSLVTYSASTDGGGAQTDHLRSVDPATLEQRWAVDLPNDSHLYTYVPLGDGLAAWWKPDGAPAPVSRHLDLRPVDLATGALGAPVVTDAYGWSTLEDGHEVVTLADVPSGRLVLAGAGGVTPFGDLPDVHAPALTLRVFGSTAYTTWGDQDGVWTTDVDGSGPWVDSVPSPGITSDETAKTFAVGGDVVLAPGGGYGDYVTWHVTWPGGSRTFDASVANLSHGGRYVKIVTTRNGAPKIVDAKTGAVVRSSTTDSSVVDGTVLWDRTTAGVLSGTDLVTNQVTDVTLPDACATASVRDIQGRWALLLCSAGQTLLDVQDPTHPVLLPANGSARLGAG